MSASCVRIAGSSNATASSRADGPKTRGPEKNGRNWSASTFDFDRVYRATACGALIQFIDLRSGRYLERDGQIDSHEIELAQKQQRRSQLVDANVKASVLHVDPAGV